MATIDKHTEQIRTAYDVLANKAGDSVRLLAIYHQVDMTRDQFHTALLDMARDTTHVFIEPEPKLRSLTAEDREIALRAGGEFKHLLSILP